MIEIHASLAREQEARFTGNEHARKNPDVPISVHIHAEWDADRLEFRDGDRAASVAVPGELSEWVVATCSHPSSAIGLNGSCLHCGMTEADMRGDADEAPPLTQDERAEILRRCSVKRGADRERLADVVAEIRARHSVTEAERLLLAMFTDGDGLKPGQCTDDPPCYDGESSEDRDIWCSWCLARQRALDYLASRGLLPVTE